MAVSPGPVVSNTTPLINLVGVNQLALLPFLYGAVTIADVVRDEYEAGKAAADPNLNSLPWIQIVSPVQLDPSLPMQIGVGEAATLTLGSALNARAVLLDEAYGRRLARIRGLPVVGTLGVLLAAKQVGQLAAIKPVIEEMVRQGRHLSASLRSARFAGSRRVSLIWFSFYVRVIHACHCVPGVTPADVAKHWRSSRQWHPLPLAPPPGASGHAWSCVANFKSCPPLRQSIRTLRHHTGQRWREWRRPQPLDCLHLATPPRTSRPTSPLPGPGFDANSGQLWPGERQLRTSGDNRQFSTRIGTGLCGWNRPRTLSPGELKVAESNAPPGLRVLLRPRQPGRCQ